MSSKTTYCKICGVPYPDDRSLHSHLRKHKTTVEKYYHAHYPRFDKCTGEIIHFKSKEKYFITNFNCRDNLIKWLQDAPLIEAQDYVRAALLSRKFGKGILYAPCQVELRSIMMPSAIFINKLFGDYTNLIKEIGFKIKYDYATKNEHPKVYSTDHTLLIDSREQIPLEFAGYKKERMKLDFGDYTIKGNKVYYFERKSLPDFVMTLSADFERFCKEIDRAQNAGAYLIIVVEAPMVEALNFHKSDHYFAKKIKYHPDCIFRNVRHLIQQFPNIQFLFVNDRQQASQAILQIGSCTTDFYKGRDLQFDHDKKMLI